MRLHPVTLSFREAELEQAFLEGRSREFLSHARFALLTGIAIVAVFGVLDTILLHPQRHTLWFIRFGLICPVALAIFLLSYTRIFLRFTQLMLSIALCWTGFGVVAMVAIAQPPGSYLYYAGLILLLMYGYTFLRLRFIIASINGLIVITAYELTAVLLHQTPGVILTSNSFFFVSANIIGMFASYIIERQQRQNYAQMRTIAADQRQLRELNRKLQEISIRDALTGLFNRRYLEQRLEEVIHLFRRYRLPSTVMLLDMDDFKLVNDRCGHAKGDAILRRAALIMTARVRDTDMVFRYGGDEFCILLPYTDASSSQLIGCRILDALRALPAEEGLPDVELSFSAGCVGVSDGHLTVHDLLAQADELLYAAKRDGKQRIRVRPGPSATAS